MAQAARQGGAMKRLDEWFSDYGQSHRHPVNVAIHKVAVPGIYLCALALLWCLPAGPLPPSPQLGGAGCHAGAGLLSAAVVFAVCGDGGADRPGLALCYTWQGRCCRGPPWPVSCCSGWPSSSVTGSRETPSFLTDLQFLLVGPAWCWPASIVAWASPTGEPGRRNHDTLPSRPYPAPDAGAAGRARRWPTRRTPSAR